MAPRTLVIVNPKSRGGATGRRWAAVEARLREVLGPIEVEHTRAPRDAERIAREGVRAGLERILVAGGDGTLSEVATGLLSADLGRYAEIGLLPLGTGGDFVRSLGVPRDLDGALACIAAGLARPVDAGRVRFTRSDGGERVAYFVNVASFGISALTNVLVNESTKVFGGTVSFLLGTIRAILRYRSERVVLRVDGKVEYDGRIVLGTSANGRYFGGGMHIAPEAKIDDGLLDVIVVPHRSVPKLLLKLPLLYAGTHLEDPATSFYRGQVIEAEAPDAPVQLELDGEPLGMLPARFESLPGALRLLGPSS